VSERFETTTRPGVVRGSCPERTIDEPPFVARLLSAATRRLRTPCRASRRRIAAVVREIDSAALGLADLSDTRFDEAVLDVRGQLLRRGLDEAILPLGFALVREASRRVLGMSHYDEQIFGGWVMAHRGAAELETGEGKTLTATLPAALAAMAGIPVHVITANDYLVERDAHSMSPLYQKLGVTVGVVVEAEGERSSRREAYRADVVYVTNKQVAFDYLRDQIAGAGDSRLSRLLDLEPSAQTEGAESPVMRGLCFAIIDEADSVLIDDARTPLILSGEGAPADEETVQQALAMARRLERDVDYHVDERRNTIDLNADGRHRLEELGQLAMGPLVGERRREEWVHRALCALHLYQRDRHYIVRDDSIDIIDLPTGRRAPDRSFEGGIQSLIEAHEELPLSPQRETIARISYQQFFRRYLHLASMTGTAREVASELHDIYGLSTVIVPPRRPSRRLDLGTQITLRVQDKWSYVVERIAALHATGRPILVGTSTVETSEHLSALLAEKGLVHEVLSARQDKTEANVIARAGDAGRITVATRMAGRGTDILLKQEIVKMGGLAVLSTELGEAGRIDRQLFGRCGRQGADGSHEQVLSLEDRLIAAHLPAWMRTRAGNSWPACIVVRKLPGIAQRAEERRGRLARRRMLESERALGDLLVFSGRRD
jgi:preprotein translocase subunit SecA